MQRLAFLRLMLLSPFESSVSDLLLLVIPFGNLTNSRMVHPKRHTLLIPLHIQSNPRPPKLLPQSIPNQSSRKHGQLFLDVLSLHPHNAPSGVGLLVQVSHAAGLKQGEGGREGGLSKKQQHRRRAERKEGRWEEGQRTTFSW